MLLFAVMACSRECPPGSTRWDDGLCHLIQDTGPDGDSGDTTPDTDSGGSDDSGDTAPESLCPEETSTEEYERYPVYIADTDRRFVTIQDAIWGAKEGDVVTVCPGTYYENIDFKGKVITVTSEQGPWVTTIDGQEVDSVVTMKNYEPPESILQGFTLTNGSAVKTRHGGGIYIEWGSPTIRYNVVINNSASIAGGVYVRNGGAIVHNNIIIGNTASEGGGGMVCTACTGVFRYNTLFENRSGNGPVAEWFWGIGDLEGNIMVSEAEYTGAAIRWMEPRGDDFETGYNLYWPHATVVDGSDADAWPEGDGVLWEEAKFSDPDSLDFTLASDSPAIDAGPPDELDADGSRADMGAYGGPDGDWPW